MDIKALQQRAYAFMAEYRALCEKYGADIDLLDHDEIYLFIDDTAVLGHLHSDEPFLYLYEPEVVA